MKLNLGCGQHRADGYINVDAAPQCAPDQVVDLEVFPWPWADGSVEVARFHHSLEHMGGDPKVFLKLMQELYRVLAPGGRVQITAPHPRSDAYLGDPTHVRIVTPQVLQLFDAPLNAQWKAQGVANTPLAVYTGVDFAITATKLVLNEPWLSQQASGVLSRDDLLNLLRTQNNIAAEWQIELTAHKPSR
jgi:SAM-dependent methyltransferase